MTLEPIRHLNSRKRHLAELWSAALKLDQLPQMDRWISEEFRKNPSFGSRDRKWYSEMLFAGIRFGFLAIICQKAYEAQLRFNIDSAKTVESWNQFLIQLKPEIDSPAKILSVWKTISFSQFFLWTEMRYLSLSGTAEAPIFATEDSEKCAAFYTEFMQFLQNSTRTDDKLCLASVPLWFGQWLEERCEVSAWTQAEQAHFLTSLATRPPLWLRMNFADRLPEVRKELEKEDFRIESHGSALQANGLKGIFATESYRTGAFEIQDLASQEIGAHVDVRPGQLVWDCCAGGGGKTLQIASLLKNKGAVFASDIREYKLDEIKKRAKRAGFFNIRCMAWDGIKKPEFPKEVQLRHGFDWVLVDAPCTSTGTWRRNPDAKYRVNAQNVENLVQLQLQLLQKAAEALKPGGHLVYSTCSWIVAENEDICREFLKSNSGFQLVSMKILGSPVSNADTMFAAVFKAPI